MLFKNSIDEGYAKIIEKDHFRAKSLMKVADDALLAAKELQLKESNYSSIVRELYEALRQYCEAIGYRQGYKFLSHEVITYFLHDVLNEEKVSLRFDHYRKLRNGINYYGRDVAQETVEKALKEVPELINGLKKHING